MENLEEDLTCSVCYCLFNDPRVLPCSHTFCKSCLENVLQVSVNYSIWRPIRLPLKCPNCRSVVELPTNGVDALPINVSLRAIVEKYQRDGQPRSATCPEHPRQPLNVYCVQDRKLICGFCLTIGQHQSHAIDDLQTAYMKERATQSRFVESLTGKRWEEVCNLVERLEQEKGRREEMVQQEREVVSRFFQGLDLILAQKKEQFMKALDGANLLIALAYNPVIEKLKDMQEEQIDLISLSSSIEDEESPLVYLEKMHQLRERVNVLTQITLPKIPSVKITPRAEEFFEEHWTNVTVRGLRDGPVPEISCHTKRCSMKSAQSTHLTHFWHLQPSSTVAVFLVLILMLAAICVNPEGGPALGLSIFSGISQIVEYISSELTQHFHDAGTFLFCLLQNINVKLSSCISAICSLLF